MSIKNLINVAKFGGTSLKDFAAMSRCANIVLSSPQTRVVVVSASAGVTNLLTNLTEKDINNETRATALAEIFAIQSSIFSNLSNSAAKEYIEQLFQQLEQEVYALEDNYSLKAVDSILAYGEMFSSFIFSEVLKQVAESRHIESIDVTCIDARSLIKTNSNFSDAAPNPEEIKKHCELNLYPYINSSICVTQGFVGSDSFGNTTTLGRGGSDFSAALIAEALNTETLQIWTDVAGIYTSDPRVVSTAKPISVINFSEAAELATFGAKVLHPATIAPAVRANVNVFVGSSLTPNEGGTTLTSESSSPGIRAIALRERQSLVTLSSPEMLLASGFLARVFAILAKYELSVDLITTSEISVALTLDNISVYKDDVMPQACIDELSGFCKVKIEKDLSLVAVIGKHEGRFGDTKWNTTEFLFKSLSPYQIRMICHGASPYNICFLVDGGQAREIINDIHTGIFGQ